jgi:hypothetical protein
MRYMFRPNRAIFTEHKSTRDTHNQDSSSTPNGAQSSRNTKDRKKRHPITSKLITIRMMHFKCTTDKSAQCSGFLKYVLPEDDLVWPKHAVHKHRMYI